MAGLDQLFFNGLSDNLIIELGEFEFTVCLKLCYGTIQLSRTVQEPTSCHGLFNKTKGLQVFFGDPALPAIPQSLFHFFGHITSSK